MLPHTHTHTQMSSLLLEQLSAPMICCVIDDVNASSRAAPGDELLVVAPLVGRADGQRGHEGTVRNDRLDQQQHSEDSYINTRMNTKTKHG